MDSNTEQQQLIDAAKEDLKNTKVTLDASQRANDNAGIVYAQAEADFDNQMAKLDNLRTESIQARVDGDIELADRLDGRIEVDTELYKQLSDIAQVKREVAQHAVSDLAWAQEYYEAAQLNVSSLVAQQNASAGSSSSSGSNASSSGSSSSSTSINAGDKIQIKVGAIDVTNGCIANSGGMYVQGGALWATVELVDTSWATGGRWNLPLIVTKVRCIGADGQTVVWQVTEDNIASNVIRADVPVQKSPTPPKPNVPLTVAGQNDLNVAIPNIVVDSDVQTVSAYTTKTNAQTWAGGIATAAGTTGKAPVTAQLKVQVSTGSSIDGSTTAFKY